MHSDISHFQLCMFFLFFEYVVFVVVEVSFGQFNCLEFEDLQT